jgi:hypothetical protein
MIIKWIFKKWDGGHGLEDEYCEGQHKKWLDNQRLQSNLHFATSEISPDINILVTRNSVSFLWKVLFSWTVVNWISKCKGKWNTTKLLMYKGMNNVNNFHFMYFSQLYYSGTYSYVLSAFYSGFIINQTEVMAD